MRRRALAEHGLVCRRLELEHVQSLCRSGDDAVRAQRSSRAAQYELVASKLAIISAEATVRSGLPARKRRNWRRAIQSRLEISDPSRAIWVISASTVMPKRTVGEVTRIGCVRSASAGRRTNCERQEP
jgi:hypothetical protein